MFLRDRVEKSSVNWKWSTALYRAFNIEVGWLRLCFRNSGTKKGNQGNNELLEIIDMWCCIKGYTSTYRVEVLNKYRRCPIWRLRCCIWGLITPKPPFQNGKHNCLKETKGRLLRHTKAYTSDLIAWWKRLSLGKINVDNTRF